MSVDELEMTFRTSEVAVCRSAPPFSLRSSSSIYLVSIGGRRVTDFRRMAALLFTAALRFYSFAACSLSRWLIASPQLDTG